MAKGDLVIIKNMAAFQMQITLLLSLETSLYHNKITFSRLKARKSA